MQGRFCLLAIIRMKTMTVVLLGMVIVVFRKKINIEFKLEK